MKRVLQIFSSLNLAGAESRVMDLYRAIDKEKVQFDFITVKPGPYFFEEEIKKIGGNIYCITDPKKSIMKNIKEMVSIMKKKGPYLAVHSHTSYYNGIAMFAGKIANIKIRIAHARNSSHNHLTIAKWIQVWIGRLLIRLFATEKLAISNLAAQFIFGTTKNVKIIPNAINIQPFLMNDLKAQTELKKELKIQNEKILLMVARFIEFKNHLFAIEVMDELVNKRNLNYQLLLVGEGDQEEKIKEKIKQYGLEKNVSILGLRTDIPSLQKITDVFLVPSKFEGMCGACVEAQAAGTKCLVSEEIPEETDMKIGLLYRASIHKGPQIWADKIEQIIKIKYPISEQEILQKFQEKKFTIEEEVKEMEKLYQLSI